MQQARADLFARVGDDPGRDAVGGHRLVRGGFGAIDVRVRGAVDHDGRTRLSHDSEHGLAVANIGVADVERRKLNVAGRRAD